MFDVVKYSEFRTIPAAGGIWIWLSNGDVVNTTFTYASGKLTTAIAITDVGFSADSAEDSVKRYRVALFDSAAELLKVRVTGIQHSEAGLFTVMVRDEVSDYYDARVRQI